MSYADLHIHSYYSDGEYSPEKIVQDAVLAGVGYLAIADHDLFEGSRALKPLLQGTGIGFLSANENTCMHRGVDYHVLAYGVDMEDENLLRLVRHNRRTLDDMSVLLIQKMMKDYPMLSLEDYEKYEPERGRGGWKCLCYLNDWGVTEHLKEGLRFYNEYDITYQDAGFTSADEMISAIHAAGGRAVLAHPGEVIPFTNAEAFKNRLLEFVEMGIDGLECYYPKHTPEVTETCLALCRERGLMITSGSDCHGSFSGRPIGSMKMPIEQLDLRGLEFTFLETLKITFSKATRPPSA